VGVLAGSVVVFVMWKRRPTRRALQASYTSGTTAEADSGRFLLAQNRKFEGLGPEEQAKWKEGFTFVQLADTQLGFLSSVAAGERIGREQGQKIGARWLHPTSVLSGWGEEANLHTVVPELASLSPEEIYGLEVQHTRRAVTAVNSMRPRPAFVVVCGDLVNAYPFADSKPEPNSNAEQVAHIKQLLDAVDDDIPLVCLCGNHDIGNRPTRKTIALWQSRFGDDYFSFWVGGVKFLSLNSQLYKDASGCPDLAKQQDAWLDRELARSAQQKPQHTVVFSHIPPFVDSPTERDDYFVFDTHTRTRLLTKLTQAGASHWFCGHYHRNAGGMFFLPGQRSRGLEVVVSNAVGTTVTTNLKGSFNGLSGMASFDLDPAVAGLRLVHVAEGGITHQYRTLAEIDPSLTRKAKL
jgi:hypothetical protein